MSDFAERVRCAIVSLRAADRHFRLFGADTHGYRFSAPLTEREVARFEQRFRIVLPRDYRDLLLDVGNGGAGPFLGLFPLGEWDVVPGQREWTPSLAGDPGAPFPHGAAWNDPDADEEQYFAPSLTNGALPICHEGRARVHLLVVTGPEAGKVWVDYRADARGVLPLGVTFAEWYLRWLDESFRDARRGA